MPRDRARIAHNADLRDSRINISTVEYPMRGFLNKKRTGADLAIGTRLVRIFWNALAYIVPATLTVRRQVRYWLCSPALWDRGGAGHVRWARRRDTERRSDKGHH